MCIVKLQAGTRLLRRIEVVWNPALLPGDEA